MYKFLTLKKLSKHVLHLIILVLISGCLESASTAVPKLVQDLNSKDSSVRNKAALKLASYGTDAKPAVPSLIALLGDKNGGVRTSAAYALRQIKDVKGLEAIETYED